MKISCRRTFGLALVAGGVCGIGAGSATAQTIVYDNTTTGTGYYVPCAVAGTAAGATDIGDQVTVVGGNPTVVEFDLPMYSVSDAGSADLRLRFYAAGATPATPLWDSGVVTMPYAVGVNLLTFAVPNVALTSTSFTWVITVVNRTAFTGDMGPLTYDPPTVGTSDDFFWANNYPGFPGWNTLYYQGNPVANLAATVKAATTASGACCKPDGTCVSTSVADCTAQSGVFHGEGSTCAAANCPPAPFAMNCNTSGTFTDISTTGTQVITGDDSVGAFTSSVTNALVTNAAIYACTNGFISDSSTFANFNNGTLPVAFTGLTFGLYPNWNDLYADAPPFGTGTGNVLHKAAVEGGVNVEIVEWYQVNDYPGGTNPRGNFEVKIFGPGGPALVQFLYQGMAWDTNGASSTVGFQWGAGLAHQSSFNAAGSLPDNAVCSIVATGGAVCYANCDHSTTAPCLNVLDFGCFLNAFAAGATYANCDNSTTVPILNVLDFGCFLNKFAAGCSNC